MEIYVQSCGIAQEHGYRWLDDKQKIVEEPDLVKKVRNLIESEAPSVVLARNSDELLLLVTGLKASRRTDYRGRKIRNSVAWVVGYTDENECTLRSLAAFALRDKLEKEIDSAVHSHGEIGFEFSLEDIQKLPKKANVVKQDLPLEKEKIRQDSEGNKLNLAIELEEHCLPKRSSNMKLDPLVVVTGIQDKETLDNAGVWRGMSSLITEDKEGEQPQNALALLFKRVSSPILGIGFFGATLVMITVLYFTFQIIPIQSLATIPSCSAITYESLIFYARQGEVDVGDESVIKVLYNPQEIKNLVLVDKDEKPFDAAEGKTNNDSKRELTYRRKFDSTEIYLIRLQGTNVTDKPICEQHIYINVRPEQG